ncbi:MAG: hypothetical protein IIB38_06135, partial [Candidatus Hydrogenedentes bacterium]|nr:hypothetical protein [Candidatus Hydrogenedentota bacterium]
MVRLIAALCLSLIAVTSLAETWVRKGFPPDKETLDRYKQGGLSDRQELLAKAFLELAGKYNDDKRTREVKDAIRRALIFHPANPAALALYEAQPALPKKPKLYKNRPLGKAYLADLQKLQARLTPELLEAAEVFAKHGMPLACRYALEQARQGNEQG